MYMRSTITLVVACVVGCDAIAEEDGPGLGHVLTAEEVAAVDYAIMPDGEGLPEGSGNAKTGRDVYIRHCQACHGEKGSGGLNDVLAGGRGTLKGPAPQKTVGSYWPYATTIFDYVRRAMPFLTPGSLSNDDIYAVTAYLLYLNGIVDENDVINAESLPAVEMPNRDNFVWGVALD